MCIVRKVDLLKEHGHWHFQFHELNQNRQESLITYFIDTVVAVVVVGLVFAIVHFLIGFQKAKSEKVIHEYRLTDLKEGIEGEPIRLILAYAGVNYTDDRIEITEWLARKPKYWTPFYQLPVLDIDNEKFVLCRSAIIARYFGYEFDLTPKDHIQGAIGNMLVEHVQVHFGPWFQEEDPVKRKEIWQQLEKEKLDPFLALYEKFIMDNAIKYFLTTKYSITWVDLFLLDVLQRMRIASPHLFDSHPKLSKFIRSIEKEPKIHSWIEKRPKSDF